MATDRPLVVVVEDDPETTRALGRVLRAAEFEVAPYVSAEAFLDAPPVRRPICLVLDVKLGGMSGLDLQRRLRSLGSDLPVIVMTGLDSPRVRKEAADGGCVAVLSKDADSQQLLSLLGRLTHGTRERN